MLLEEDRGIFRLPPKDVLSKFRKAMGGSSLALGLVKQSLQLLLAGGLLLLHQVSVALGDTPAIGLGHGGTQWTARGRLQLLPVIAAGPAGISQLH